MVAWDLSMENLLEGDHEALANHKTEGSSQLFHGHCSERCKFGRCEPISTPGRP